MRKRTAQGLALALLVGLGAFQGPAKAGPADHKTAIVNTVPAMARNARAYEVGTASWYGDDFEGKPTASGEPYNMYDLTAAHPTLPLGTFVKVTNLRNGRSVVVKVNDRGPIVPGRIIDVSYSTARVLQFKAQGLQRGRLDLVQPKMAQPQTMAMLQPMAF